jgi:ribosomal protein S18 acetylase RimI-like enzyme
MSSTSLSFELFDDPPEPARRAVDAGLESHNLSAAPLSDVRSLAAFASTPTGVVVGGAVGRTWGACCEIQQLWVAPAHRRSGTATRLLLEFEQRAAARGCRVFYLTTLSFQAPDFYRRRGYEVLASISGYPDNIIKYLMHKIVSDDPLQRIP